MGHIDVSLFSRHAAYAWTSGRRWMRHPRQDDAVSICRGDPGPWLKMVQCASDLKTKSIRGCTSPVTMLQPEADNILLVSPDFSSMVWNRATTTSCWPSCRLKVFGGGSDFKLSFLPGRSWTCSKLEKPATSARSMNSAAFCWLYIINAAFSGRLGGSIFKYRL